MQGGDLHDLQYCWNCNILVVFPTLGLNAVKIIDYIQKCFEQKLRRIKFPAKNSVEAYLYLPQECSQGAPNIRCLLELKSGFFLELEPSKLSIILKNASNKNCIKLDFQ